MNFTVMTRINCVKPAKSCGKLSRSKPTRPRLRELPKVTVALKVDAGAEDQEICRQHGAQGLREVQICRMTEETIEQGGLLTQEDLADILKVDARTIRCAVLPQLVLQNIPDL